MQGPPRARRDGQDREGPEGAGPGGGAGPGERGGGAEWAGPRAGPGGAAGHTCPQFTHSLCDLLPLPPLSLPLPP